MNFDYNAYERVFPAKPTPSITTDSAVDGYNPTASEANGTGKTENDDLNAVSAQDQPTQPAQPTQGTNIPLEGKTADMGENQPAQGTQPDNGGKGE